MSYSANLNPNWLPPTPKGETNLLLRFSFRYPSSHFQIFKLQIPVSLTASALKTLRLPIALQFPIPSALKTSPNLPKGRSQTAQFPIPSTLSASDLKTLRFYCLLSLRFPIALQFPIPSALKTSPNLPKVRSQNGIVSDSFEFNSLSL